MTKGSNMSVEPIHSFSAVLRGAFILILFACSMLSYAQTFSSTSSYRVDGKVAPASEQTQRYSSYQSTVYEPFGNTTPSESNASSRGVSGRRNSDYEGDVNLDGWGDPTTGNPGNTSNQSPIGEPWIMLLFAAAAAATVTWRKRKVT
jgi:hypothetical protein